MTAYTDTTAEATERSKVRIGHDLTGATDIDSAVTRADLDWGLKVVPADNLSVTTEDGVFSTAIPGMRMVMRDDTYTTMGVVGGRYTEVDNRSVMSIGKTIMDQGGVPTSGGPLDHGRKVFMKFDLPDAQVKVGGVDLVDFGVVLRASHDGSGNVMGQVVGTRLWCINGCTTKIKGVPNEFKIRHTASAEQRIAEAHKIMEGAALYANSFVAATDAMLDTKFTLAQYKRFIDNLFPRPEEDEGRAVTLWENRRNELITLFKFADTNDMGRNTVWGGFNAVTEYLDWNAPVRATGGQTQPEARARRQFENTTQATKDQAFAMLGAMV